MEDFNLIPLSYSELEEINGGGSLFENWEKDLEDAGQFVGGFLYGLFVGECPSDC